MKKKKETFLTPQQAAKLTGVTPITIYNWCNQWGIGEKVGGRWLISASRLDLLRRAKKNSDLVLYHRLRALQNNDLGLQIF